MTEIRLSLHNNEISTKLVFTLSEAIMSEIKNKNPKALESVQNMLKLAIKDLLLGDETSA